MKITAETRTVVKSNYALITPDGLVNSAMPGWTDCEFNVIINPAMGARFSQHLITFNQGGQGQGSTQASELFFFVIEGSCQAEVNGSGYELKEGNYIYMPPGSSYSFRDPGPTAKLLSFQKRYEPLDGHQAPDPVFGQLSEVSSEIYMEDPQLHMQNLLPADQLSFDMAVNVFTYDPGGNLPFVETHIMEHGLIYLAGQGIYRLDNDWYAVSPGDCIWMAPYCPQWFVAMGKEPAVYIYYKNVNRFSIGQ